MSMNTHVCQSLDTDEIKERLLVGNRRYMAGRHQPKVDGDNILFRLKMNSGQKPAVAVVGCADSRCNPQVVTDLSEGEMFMTRVAGNYVGTSVAGSIQYACRHLGTKFVLAMGHTKCGAIAAAQGFEGSTVASEDDDALTSLVKNIKGALDDGGSFGEYAVKDECDRELVKEQVQSVLNYTSSIERKNPLSRVPRMNLAPQEVVQSDLVISNVIEQMGILKNVLDGIPDVAICGAVFHLDTGKVMMLPKYVKNNQLRNFTRKSVIVSQ